MNHVCRISVWPQLKHWDVQSLKPIPPQKKPKQSLLPVVSSPETLCFWAEHPSFLYRTPSVTLLPPLPPSPSLCFYLGAVRAPLLKLLLKREHIQWGLSQSLSVSIKDPGNTTLSREPLLKGQWDPGSFATWVPAPPIPSFSWEKRKKQESTQQINYSWMVCELCRALSQAPSAAVTCSVQTDAVTSDITVCNNTTWTRTAALRPTSDGNHAGTAAFIYTTADASVCFGWSGTFKQIPRHCDDIILLMRSDKIHFFGHFPFFPSLHQKALSCCCCNKDIKMSC